MDHVIREMGIRIYELRKQMGITQSELAERCGMNPQNISTAELGKKALRPESIVKLSHALGVSTDYLLTGCRTSADHSLILAKLEKTTTAKYDQILRVVDIMLED